MLFDDPDMDEKFIQHAKKCFEVEDQVQKISLLLPVTEGQSVDDLTKVVKKKKKYYSVAVCCDMVLYTYKTSLSLWPHCFGVYIREGVNKYNGQLTNTEKFKMVLQMLNEDQGNKNTSSIHISLIESLTDSRLPMPNHSDTYSTLLRGN